MCLLFSYCAMLFRQLHSFLQKAHKSSLRILTGGQIIINLIINIGDSMGFLTVSVNIDEFISKINCFVAFTDGQKFEFRLTRVSWNMQQIKEPSEFLKNAIGKIVRVKLNSGFSYKGID